MKNYLMSEGYFSQAMNLVPQGEDRDEKLSWVITQLVNEVMKGKKPDDVLPKLKVELPKNKAELIQVITTPILQEPKENIQNIE